MNEWRAVKARSLVRVACALVVSLSALLLAREAAAFPVDLETLPVNTPLGGPPTDVPTSIPRKEHLGSLFAMKVSPSHDHRYHGVSLYSSQEEMESMTTSDGFAVLRRQTPNTCFMVAAPTGVNDTEKLRGWEITGERSPVVSSYEGYRRVGAVRMERFVEAEGKNWLHVTDFFIDTSTGGARRFGDNRLEFKEIARPYDGVILYAARTADNKVEVLLRSVESRMQKQLYEGIGTDATLQVHQSGFPDANISLPDLGLFRNCGQHRVHLELPALDAPQLLPTESASFTKLSTSKGRVIRIPAFGEPTPGPTNQAKFQLVPLTGWENGSAAQRTRFGTLRGMAVRPLVVNVGVSRLSADSGPLLSVSYRWAAEPSRIQVVASDNEGEAQLIDLGP